MTDKEKMNKLISAENLIKILESGIMIESFYKELKSNNDVSRAIWYSMRDYPTNLALRIEIGEGDFNPFNNENDKAKNNP